MYPTLAQERGIALVSRLHKYGNNIKVGDIIEAENPVFVNKQVGKRVIGMPGDYVIRDPSMSPSSGGAPIPGIVDDDGNRKEPQMIEVPEGHVWAVGDNLSWSRDSRFYGPLPMALIRGKIIAFSDGLFGWRWIGDSQLTPVPDEE